MRRDDFVEGIRSRRAFFTPLGFQDVRVTLLDQQRLSEGYVLARAESVMRFGSPSGSITELTSTSTYIVSVEDGTPGIVFYLTHEDLRQVIREHGLLPSR